MIQDGYPIFPSNNDDNEDSIDLGATNKRQLIVNQMRVKDLNELNNVGVICNLARTSNFVNNTNTIKIYMWVVNPSATSSSFKMFGCSFPCISYTDFNLRIRGGNIYDQNQLQVEVVTLTKSMLQGNYTRVTLNSYTDFGKDVYFRPEFGANSAKLNLLMTFTTARIKLSYLQYNFANPISGLLKGNGNYCSDTENCIPGFVCVKPGNDTCTGDCHPACRKCKRVSTTAYNNPNHHNQCESCSPISSRWSTTPDIYGSCLPIDHIDVAQIKPFSIKFPARYSNSYTLSFWIYFQSAVEFDPTEMIKIQLEGVMSLAIGKSSRSTPTAICTIYTGFYPELDFIDDFSLLDKVIWDSAYDTVIPEGCYGTTSCPVNYMGAKIVYGLDSDNPNINIDNKWSFVRCAYSTDNKKMYVMHSEDSLENREVTQKSLIQYQTYYSGEESEIPWRYFYINDTMFLNVSIPAGFSNANAVYLKNLQILTDYMPPDSGYQYYDWGALSNNLDFPSLFIGMNFDRLDVINLTQTTTLDYYHFNSSYQKINKIVNVTFYPEANFKMPWAFYRLNLVSATQYKNKFYNVGNLYTTQMGNLSCSTGEYCLKNNVSINCKIGYYFDYLTSQCLNKCSQGTAPSVGSIFSTNLNRGFCTRDTFIKHFNETSYDYSNSFTSTCKSTFHSIHMECYQQDNDFKGALHFSSRLQSLPIEIKMNNSEHYYLEFWFYADPVLLPYVKSSNFFSEERLIFLTNSFKISYTCNASEFFSSDDIINNTAKADGQKLIDQNSKQCYTLRQFDGTAILPIFASFGSWTKFQFHANKTATSQSGDTYSINNFQMHESISYRSINYKLNLNATYFCHGKPCGSIKDYDIKWFSGFYKFLRVWNADMIPTEYYKDLDS